MVDKAGGALADQIAGLIRTALDKEEFSSLTALARKAGIDPAQLSRFLHGQRDMTLGSANKVLDALGVKLAPIVTPEKLTQIEQESKSTPRPRGLPMVPMAVTADEQAEEKELEGELEDERERMVLRGKTLGLSHREIAKMLGCPQSEVDLIYRMIRKRYVKLFGEAAEEEE